MRVRQIHFYCLRQKLSLDGFFFPVESEETIVTEHVLWVKTGMKMDEHSRDSFIDRDF
jgi:hypothetical protein